MLRSIWMRAVAECLAGTAFLLAVGCGAMDPAEGIAEDVAETEQASTSCTGPAAVIEYSYGDPYSPSLTTPVYSSTGGGGYYVNVLSRVKTAGCAEIISFGGSTQNFKSAKQFDSSDIPPNRTNVGIPYGSYGLQWMDVTPKWTYNQAQYYYLPCSGVACTSMSWWQNNMLYAAP